MRHESGFSTSTKNPPVATPVALFKFPLQCHSTHLQSAFLHKTLPPCDCQVTGFFVHKLLKLQHSWCQAGYKNGHEDQGEASLHQRLHGFFKLILLDKNSAEVEIYMKPPNPTNLTKGISCRLVEDCFHQRNVYTSSVLLNVQWIKEHRGRAQAAITRDFKVEIVHCCMESSSQVAQSGKVRYLIQT